MDSPSPPEPPGPSLGLYRVEHKNWCVVLRGPRKSHVAAVSGCARYSRAFLATWHQCFRSTLNSSCVMWPFCVPNANTKWREERGCRFRRGRCEREEALWPILARNLSLLLLFPQYRRREPRILLLPLFRSSNKPNLYALIPCSLLPSFRAAPPGRPDGHNSRFSTSERQRRPAARV